MQKWAPGAAVLVLAAWTQLAAVQLALDTRALDEAIAIGQSRVASQQTQFHSQYRVPVEGAAADYIDVITPFRRVVLAAEARARAGERPLTHRQALDALDGHADRIDLVVELTFHPHHTFVRVPDYELVLISPAGLAIEPVELDRIPRYGPRSAGPPMPHPPAPAPGEQRLPFTGGTVMARFDAYLLGTGGAATAVLTENGVTVARAPIAFGGLR